MIQRYAGFGFKDCEEGFKCATMPSGTPVKIYTHAVLNSLFRDNIHNVLYMKITLEKCDVASMVKDYVDHGACDRIPDFKESTNVDAIVPYKCVRIKGLTAIGGGNAMYFDPPLSIFVCSYIGVDRQGQLSLLFQKSHWLSRRKSPSMSVVEPLRPIYTPALRADWVLAKAPSEPLVERIPCNCSYKKRKMDYGSCESMDVWEYRKKPKVQKEQNLTQMIENLSLTDRYSTPLREEENPFKHIVFEDIFDAEPLECTPSKNNVNSVNFLNTPLRNPFDTAHDKVVNNVLKVLENDCEDYLGCLFDD